MTPTQATKLKALVEIAMANSDVRDQLLDAIDADTWRTVAEAKPPDVRLLQCHYGANFCHDLGAYIQDSPRVLWRLATCT